MITKHPINSPNVVDRRRSKDQLDRNVFDFDRWKLESELAAPGPVSFDSVTGSDGVIQISVSQLNGDLVDGWEMCHATADITSPTGLAYTFESGGKFLIPTNSGRNVWVRPKIGLRRGEWQGYGEIPEGEEVFTQTFYDETFVGETKGGTVQNTTIVFGHAMVYNGYGPSGIYNQSAYNQHSVTLFNAAHTARHSALGGRIVCTLWGAYADPSEIGFVLMARAEALSDPNDDFYVLALKKGDYSGGQHQYYFVLYRVSGQTFTLVDSSSNMNSYGTWLGNNQEGLNGVLQLPVIIDRNGSVFTVRNAADTATLWTVTDTNITPDDTRVYVGTYQIHSAGYIRPAFTVSRRNYAGALAVINPGSFVDPILEVNLTEPVNLSHYIRIASGNTGNDSVRVRWDNNLQLVADRDRPAGTTQETVVLNPKFKVGTLTRDASAATGTVATTGLGFKPRAIQFDWVLDGTTISGRAVYDGTTLSGTTFTTTWAQTSSIDCYTSGTNRQYATVSSLNTDGFTLSWTKVDSPTGTIKITYFAFQ